MKPSEYLFCPFGRKVALNVGYKEYQYTEQNHDLDHIIDEKLNTSSELSICIKTAGVQHRADQPVQPFHTENLVLYKVPNFHKTPFFSKYFGRLYSFISFSTISTALSIIFGHSVANSPFALA